MLKKQVIELDRSRNKKNCDLPLQTTYQRKKAPKKAECEELSSRYREMLSNLYWVKIKTAGFNRQNTDR